METRRCESATPCDNMAVERIGDQWLCEECASEAMRDLEYYEMHPDD